MAEADDQSENAEHVRQFAVFPEAERFVAVVDVGKGRERRQVAADLQQGEQRPAEQHHHHHGRDLHDPERLFAGFLDALDVLPPEVEGDGHGEQDRGGVDADLRRAVEHVMNGGGDPAAGVGDGDGVVDQAGDVLSRGNAGDRPGQYVVEHQRRDTELGEGAAESFFDDTIDAAAHEHRAAFHVDGTDGEGEQHDAQNKPGSALANRLFGDAAGIESGRTEVVENDGGSSPVGDEGEHDRGRNYNANPVIAGGCVRGRRHAAGALVAVLVLPVQQGSDVFVAREQQHNYGPDPPGDKHEFQNLNQDNADTHNHAMLSDRRGPRRGFVEARLRLKVCLLF